MNLGWLCLEQVKRDKTAGLLKSREEQILALLELCWKEQRAPLYAEIVALKEQKT